MSVSDIVWWTGFSALLMYLGAIIYIFTGMALAYYRKRK